MDSQEKLKEFLNAVGVIGEIEALLYLTLVDHDVPAPAAKEISVDTTIKMLGIFGGIR